MTRALGAALLAASLVGCASLGLPPRLADCPGPLRPSGEIPGDFVRQERIRVRGTDVDEAFGLVLQKRGERLTVLGFSAFGAKAFSLVQQGLAVESDSQLGRALPVPPENVLRDVHRAYFLTPEQAAASERSLATTPAGALLVRSEACGYEATLVRVGGGDAPIN